MATRKQAARKAAKKSGRGAPKSGNPFAKGGRFYKGNDDNDSRPGDKKSLKGKVRGKK